MQGFTKYFDNKVDAIFTDVIIINPNNNLFIKTNGLWDTGASISVISKEVAQYLMLPIKGRNEIEGISGTLCANKYNVDVILPNNILIQNLIVNESLQNDVGILIGRDIMMLGKTIIDDSGNRTVFSFFIP